MRNTTQWCVVGCSAMLLAVCTAAPATPPPHAHNGKAKRDTSQRHSQPQLRGFTSTERDVIVDYFTDDPQVLDQSRKGLPPGIQKKLARGGTLPPGIAKQFPDSLSQRLPPLPGGYDRVVVDGRVLLIELATRAILDVLIP